MHAYVSNTTSHDQSSLEKPRKFKQDAWGMIHIKFDHFLYKKYVTSVELDAWKTYDDMWAQGKHGVELLSLHNTMNKHNPQSAWHWHKNIFIHKESSISL